MRGCGMISLIVLVIAGLFGAYQVVGYASLAGGQETIRGKTAEIWNQIERASELLPRLEQQFNVTVDLQRDLIEEIASARSAFDTASQGDTSDPGNVENAAQAFFALRSFVENYPNIGLTEIQRGLFDETAGSVNRITYARGELINAQTAYNRSRVLFVPIGLFWPDEHVLGEDENPRATLPPSRVGVSPAP